MSSSVGKLASLAEHIGRSEFEQHQFVERLEWPLEVLANNGLEGAYQYKRGTLNRLREYMDEADLGQGGLDEDVLNTHLLRDYECFCAFYITVPILDPLSGEERMGAMYPSQAQAELVKLIEKHDTVIVLFSRQSGKSTTLSTYALYYACGHQNTRLNLLAPTEDQLEVMKDVYHFTRDVPYLKDKFIGKGEHNKTKIKFATGTMIEAKNINPNTGGDYKRGMRGTCFVDEWTLISDDTIKKVLEPLQSNMYAAVKLIYTGTPIIDRNPKAQDMADAAKDSPDIGYLHVSCWENIELGATKRGKIAEVFQKNAIPCEFGKKGFCPRFWRNGGNWVKPDESWADFNCDQVCYEYDEVVMEYFAEFPAEGSRVFPKTWIQGCYDPDTQLSPINNVPEGGRNRIMSIDLGFTGDPTVVLVCDPVFNHKNGHESLQVIGWHELKPEKNMVLGTNIFRDRIQEFYHIYQPNIIFCDVTRNETFVENLYKTGSKIPRRCFYANETQARKNSVGIYWHGSYKHEMIINHRAQVQAGNWIVPTMPSKFAKRWFDDHWHITAVPTDDGRYKKYPNTGHTFDAAIMASLWLDGKGRGKKAYPKLVW